MKRILIIVLVLLILVSAIGCTSEKQDLSVDSTEKTKDSDVKAEETTLDNNKDLDSLEEVLKELNGIHYTACEDVLNDIITDIEKSKEEIETSYNSLMSEIGEDYESFSAHADDLYAWFDSTQKETEKVFSMMVERSKIYYLLLAVTVGPESVFYPKNRMMELHTPVYNAFNDIWMSVYMKNSEIWDKLYPILKTHKEDLEKLKEVREPFKTTVLEYKNTFYKQYQDTYDEVYKAFRNGEINIVKYFE